MLLIIFCHEHKLQTLIFQISQIFKIAMPPSHVLEDYVEVVQHFGHLMNVASGVLEENDECLYLLLDSLDQLSPMNNALKYLNCFIINMTK